MPTWLTGLLVTVWIARSASERPRNSQMSPVAASATASSKGRVTNRNLRGDAGADLEAPGHRRARGRDRHGRRRRTAQAGAAGVRPGRAAREAARAAGGGAA